MQNYSKTNNLQNQLIQKQKLQNINKDIESFRSTQAEKGKLIKREQDNFPFKPIYNIKPIISNQLQNPANMLSLLHQMNNSADYARNKL